MNEAVSVVYSTNQQGGLLILPGANEEAEYTIPEFGGLRLAGTQLHLRAIVGREGLTIG